MNCPVGTQTGPLNGSSDVLAQELIIAVTHILALFTPTYWAILSRHKWYQMAISTETLIAIIGLFVALPPSLLVLGKMRRWRRRNHHRTDPCERAPNSLETIPEIPPPATARQSTPTYYTPGRLVSRQTLYAAELEMKLELGRH